MKIGLENFDPSIHKWNSVAKEQLRLKAHQFDPEKCTLSVLDQRLLPGRSVYVPIRSLNDGYDAIKQMKVRGAPLIATVGMLTLLVEQSRNNVITDQERFLKDLEQNCQFLLSARITAINLANAFSELLEHAKRLKKAGIIKLKIGVRNFVLEWQARERVENDLLLRNSVHAVLAATGNIITGKKCQIVAITICNTGQLATSSWGTALGVILMLHQLGYLKLALVLETRPYNQGSRLTSYELKKSGVPFLLIADSAAAAAIRHFKVGVALAGADQVALNGDTANKIGTYSLAICAHQHEVPFFVVTPAASINAKLENGNGIRVEERPSKELTHWAGVSHCPTNCPVWNPAFDITPGNLISGYLTERGNFLSNQLAEVFSTNGVHK
ncbi:Methylthioribose-1-phosphate isomerase [Meloidogyne graminicola]|uniref:Methylthioribose-1-phosphate isomerase n=1 Tax=Meloidogyne graminicola TaxID=189291 RepID=A0A8S9ZM62_9BILA|nr:Methylthioribose-1-phosphate isomerase [Meloidogyne graminicola]